MTVPGNVHALMLGGEQGYKIERSLRFNSADSAYLNRTAGTPTNVKKWTWSGWVKRSGLGTYQGIFDGYLNSANWSTLHFWNDDRILFYNLLAGVDTSVDTVGVFRDCSAWYHIVFVWDSDNATVADRAIIYVNGARQSTTNNYGTITSGEGTYWNNSYAQSLGRRSDAGYCLNGLLTEINFIDGQALTPSSFGETDTITGVWKPKKYTGTYGTNGFYLNFSDNSGTTSTTLGKDSSGNGNNWTPNNFSVTAGAGNDSLIDTPTPYADGGNGRGNYCTLNPLSSSSVATLSNGNLDVNTGTTGGGLTLGTFAMPQSGKWYWEVTPTSIGSAACRIGIANTLRDTNVEYYNDGTKVVNGASTSYGASYTDNDVIGIACDIGGNTVTFYKNNSSQGSISFSSWSTVTVFPMIADGSGSLGVTAIFNFGQRPFSYTVPAGLSALNTQTLPEPSIKKPGNYFDTKLYTGNNGTLTVTGLGFSPDLVWIKNREVAGAGHVLQDQVRGTTAYLQSNSTAAENTNTANNWFRAFTSDGFTVAATTTGGSATSEWNNNGSGYVAWCWDESATPGFDIVTYTGDGTTGRAIAHSLGVAPSMMIVKCRTSGTNSWATWQVYHSALATPTTSFLRLNETAAAYTGYSYAWGNTAPTSSNFYVSYYLGAGINGSSDTFVAYLWSEVANFSKFGSYTGNGSSDGPFVFCGFRPRFLLMKRTDSTSNWMLRDTARATYNAVDTELYADLNNAESGAAGAPMDFLSNGFKLRGAGYNSNGATWIFAAFAEAPFKYSLAR